MTRPVGQNVHLSKLFESSAQKKKKKNIYFLFISVDLEQTIVRQHMT